MKNTFSKLGQLIEVQRGFAFESAGFQDSGKFALLTAGNFHEAGGLRQLGSQQKFYGQAVDPKWVLAPGALYSYDRAGSWLAGVGRSYPRSRQMVAQPANGVDSDQPATGTCPKQLF